MKTIWLVRHAKSSWQLNTLPDIDRPLNERGYRDAHEMPARALAAQPRPTLFITSPAVRTYTTALIFARHLRYPIDQVVSQANLYESSLDEYLSVLTNIDAKQTSVLLVGHNPVITALANHLTAQKIDNVPTCGVLHISLPINNWDEIARTKGSLHDFDYPKKPDGWPTNRDD